MKRLADSIVRFFHSRSYTIASTIDDKGFVHSSCKGIVHIDNSGKIYLLDLYRARTLNNLKQSPSINLTAVDEHRFEGYCLKGKARIVDARRVNSAMVKAWEERIVKRISKRILMNIRGEKGHRSHPEALLPKPEYLILMKVQEVVNLTPQEVSGTDTMEVK